MKAIRIDGRTPGGDRNKLSESIPLSTPYLVQVFPVYGCNFKCNYCIHSIDKSKRGYVTEKKVMDYELYKKCIDELCDFPEKIKMLRFAGTGEPLLHNNIVSMVDYAVKKEVASSIDIVTNGALLKPELSKALVDSGLTRIRISIQGVNAKKYKHTIGVEFDFDKFIENLIYLYENKENTQIYIKVIDCALDNDDDQKFFEIFGDLCDVIAIENVIPATSQIDYSRIMGNENSNLTQNGVNVSDIEVCSQPFYLMQINPDGNIVPCCAMETTHIVGNCKYQNLSEIWNGKKFKDFRKVQLMKKKSIYSVCNKCQLYKHSTFSEDILDYDAERLLKIFK
ncbi:radical SAM protein [uncultured Acetobacterium sp.]|uniref:radical SAM/SPASM domain-containing protein n=1 Tax=uncultured Acetobacterium sp. TaxID=217139 RepID=UPI0025D02164|nr:radical SAM protein [uncultured Acetobacterium sp.]